MLQAIQFLAAPLVMCLVLAGIHCYLGLHVLARGVIFVDLSLAQVAALGASLALLWGFEGHSAGVYFISLGATFIAAALFALSRRHERDFPQEALIGIVYAMSAAAVVLVADRLAHGDEHIKELLVGQVLWVTWHDVAKTTLIYSVVGALHWAFRGPLLNISFGRPQANAAFWDFVFYALFGVVITSSVGVAGVLQVFAYLIVPSVVGAFLFQSIRARLFFGWGLGIVLSVISMALSYRWDLPAGAFIVVAFTLVPVVMLMARCYPRDHAQPREVTHRS
ncbi:MAG: metal ABC transporter permease [Bdellovibrionales bacterium]|nr:metal ABC transporter permease [Bdellovibrionales bacterium]